MKAVRVPVHVCAVQDKPLLYGVDVSSSKMFKSQRVRAAAAFAAAAHAGQVRRQQQDTCVLGSVGALRAPLRSLSHNPEFCSGMFGTGTLALWRRPDQQRVCRCSLL